MFKQLKEEKGFTIIEVLIVLAIAGLIMVVVFLAVPALNRNNRNERYRTDSRNILAASQEISNNKGGNILTASNSTCAAPGCDASKIKDSSNAKEVTNVVIAAHSATAIAAVTGTLTAAQLADSTSVSLTKSVIRTGAKCTGPADGTALAATPRQYALYYAVENNSGDPILQCLDS